MTFLKTENGWMIWFCSWPDQTDAFLKRGHSLKDCMNCKLFKERASAQTGTNGKFSEMTSGTFILLIDEEEI